MARGLFYEIDRFTEQNQNEAKCSFCNQHAREKLVAPGVSRRARVYRTNLHIHMEGWVEICEWCAEELGQAIGMIRASAAEGLRTLYEQAVDQRDKFQAERDEKDQMVKSLAGELARAAEEQASKVAAAYDRGLDQGFADAELERQQDAEAEEQVAKAKADAGS